MFIKRSIQLLILLVWRCSHGMVSRGIYLRLVCYRRSFWVIRYYWVLHVSRLHNLKNSAVGLLLKASKNRVFIAKRLLNILIFLFCLLILLVLMLMILLMMFSLFCSLLIIILFSLDILCFGKILVELSRIVKGRVLLLINDPPRRQIRNHTSKGCGLT